MAFRVRQTLLTLGTINIDIKERLITENIQCCLQDYKPLKHSHETKEIINELRRPAVMAKEHTCK